MSIQTLPPYPYLAVAPGRVNMLGEHVDYNDGVVLPAAIDRSVRVAAQPRSDRQVYLTALDLNESASFDLDHLAEKRTLTGKPLPAWARYPAGVAWALQEQGYAVNGVDAVFTSDVPIGAGLSSSAAVEVAFAALWRQLGGWDASAMTLARLSQAAENRYVGVNCGLMDQFASAHGVEGHCLYFDTRSLDWKPVLLPAGTVIIIANSLVKRSLAESAYNERRAACETAVELLKPHLPGIRALRDVSTEDFARLSYLLPEVIARRAQHIVEECARVEEAVDCLNRGDADGFGRLMIAGHASLRDLYEVSCPELDVLVDTAKSLPGCLGARLTGAGFGGCTVNLVEESAAGQFIQSLSDEYTRLTGKQTEVYLCRASRGAFCQAQ